MLKGTEFAFNRPRELSGRFGEEGLGVWVEHMIYTRNWEHEST